MKDKEAISILMKLREKYPLTEEEKEAVSSAIGILAWTKLSESRMKSIKNKQREKSSF